MRWGAVRLSSISGDSGRPGGVAIIDRMERLQVQPGRFRPTRFDVVLATTVLAMAGITALLLVDPSLSVVIVDRTLDVALTSLTTLAAAGLAALAMLRYRESARVSTLLQASAFLTLASLSGVTVAMVLLKLDGRVGLTLGLPEQLPLYVWSFTWLTAAGLFLAGGAAALRTARARPPHVRWVLFTPILVIAAVSVVVYPDRSRLPELIGKEGLAALVSDPHGGFPLTGISPIAYGLAVLTAVLFLAGALAYRRTYVRKGPVADGFLSIALVIAGFGGLQQAFYPSVYTGLVTDGYWMRLVSYGVLLLGIYAEQRADLRALRAAYGALDRLRVTEAERAALEERSRLAREIHDGLAQHLWFAKLKFERLAGQLPEESRHLSGEVIQALDSAIVEARQAMVTMRTSIDQDLPLSEMIARMADDFGARSGLRVEYQAGPTLPAAIVPRQQVELLRILQEALTNVRKHADATVVRIHADTADHNLVVSVADNGRGFDPHEARHDGMGLLGMEERARLMGGQLHVTSEPSNGTQVELTLPLPQVPVVPGVGDATGGTAAAAAAVTAATVGAPPREGPPEAPDATPTATPPAVPTATPAATPAGTGTSPR